MTAKEICNDVLDHHDGVNMEQIKSISRKAHIVRARDECIYRIMDDLGYSYPRIGAILNRDHSTIIHAYKRHEKRLANH